MKLFRKTLLFALAGLLLPAAASMPGGLLARAASGATTTTVAYLTPASCTVGDVVLYRATVTDDAYTPSGWLDFYDNGTRLGNAAVYSGEASAYFEVKTAGSHAVTAKYLGDSNCAPSEGSTSLTASKASTTVSLQSGMNPCVYGFSFNIGATVGSPVRDMTPTGTVTFYDGDKQLGSKTITDGRTYIPVSGLTTGAHNLTGVYSGDDNFIGSTSPILVQTITQNTTFLWLSSTPNPSNFNEPVTITGNVEATDATGTVDFTEGTALLGTGTVNNGKATLTISTLSIGDHALTASYSGDTNYKPATTADPITQTVRKEVPVFTLTSSANPCIVGHSVTFTVTGPRDATGTARFSIDYDRVATVPLSDGVATYTTSTLALGDHLIEVRYSGNDKYQDVYSNDLTEHVNPNCHYTVHYIDGITGKPAAPDKTGTGNPGDKITESYIRVHDYALGGPSTATITLVEGDSNVITFRYLSDTTLLLTMLGGLGAAALPAVMLIYAFVWFERQRRS